MTTAVYRSGTSSLAVPQTQNTAPVLEFNCLYTHDIRRKQKRWQDGFLRFHTFNKRVMVYDIPRNFIGDMHWKAEDELQDGDEIALEREGVLVQVAESIGRTETDLTELRKAKKKGSSEAGSSSPARPAKTPAPQVPHGDLSRPTPQLKHRALNALLQTPKGPMGKAAFPTKSPFEERYAEVENTELETGRPSKRMRLEQPPASNVTRTTTTSNPNSGRKEPLRQAGTSHAAKLKKKTPLAEGQQKLGTKEIIDLSMDEDENEKFLAGFSSDALQPASPTQNERPPARGHALIRSSSPAFQRQKTPEIALERLSAKNSIEPDPTDVARRRHRVDAPPLEVYQGNQPLDSRPRNVERGKSADRHPVESAAGVHDAHIEPTQSMRPPPSKSGKTLRMAASARKKKTLLCQDQASAKPSRVYSANTEHAIDALLDATSQDAITHMQQQPKSQRRQLQDRLAKIDKKSTSARNGVSETHDHGSTNNEAGVLTTSGVRPEAPVTNNGLEQAQADRMIMPVEPQSPQEHPTTSRPTERQLRRVLSETNDLPAATKRTPGAPVQFTPSPAKKAIPSVAQQKQPTAATTVRPVLLPPPKPRAKTTIQRSVSLNTTSNGTSTVILNGPFQAPQAPARKAAAALGTPADPWSREAFDLFTWRPEGWDEENWCLKDKEDTAVSDS